MENKDENCYFTNRFVFNLSSLPGEKYERDKRLQAKMITNLIMAKDRLELLGENQAFGHIFECLAFRLHIDTAWHLLNGCMHVECVAGHCFIV